MPGITLRLRGQLAERLPGGSGVYEVDEGSTLEAFLVELDLAARHYVVMLNNTVGPDRTTLLKNGDLIVVYPQMAGG
ncbi:MAG: hypothetical protein HKL81_02895 [Acidimicrobiaceae bacterium]|nr:hypothetical protein [Acidimicrobiaceae bacterium]